MEKRMTKKGRVDDHKMVGCFKFKNNLINHTNRIKGLEPDNVPEPHTPTQPHQSDNAT